MFKMDIEELLYKRVISEEFFYKQFILNSPLTQYFY